MTALHRYTLDIEYTDDPAYHPVTVYVRPSDGSAFEFHGRKLKPLLSKALAFVHEREQGENRPDIPDTF